MKKIVLFALFIVASVISSGQQLCAFDQKMKELIASDPQNARQVIETEQSIRNYIASHPPGTANATTVAYTIPVVVHVMHTGGAVGSTYNPADANITGFIAYLNQVYAGTYPGMEIPVGGSSVVNMELTFALAQRTPSCGATNGIDRVDASSLPNYTAFGVNADGTSGCPDLTLKDFARWNPADYYNIWVVNKIDGADGTAGQFIAGYAYFAGSAANLDGTVMLATQVLAGQKTLPHEIGHAFNLYHTFEGSSLNTSCPANADCANQGDRVCDTDPVTNNVNGSGVYSFVCRTTQNTCLLPTVANHNKNTENNFMAYTNCYTLFTNGQKARVQAAMSLPSRASLGTSLGETPCGTVINFALATDAKTENNAGTVTGCRKYTDYTYQMSIGTSTVSPSTVTLSFTGTAAKGLDYEVTTNGNFTTPSSVLTFPASSVATQSFTVRVFDDAATETAETIILDFTVTGGATKGTTTPTLTITINDNDLAAAANTSVTQTWGAANVATTTSAPFNGNGFTDKRTQNLYYASDLLAAGFTAGNITNFSWNFNSTTVASFNNLTVSIGFTSSTGMEFGFDDPSPVFTTIYTGNFTTPGVTGWYNFTLPTPVAWNGTDNIIIQSCWDNSAVTADVALVGTTVAYTASTYIRQNAAGTLCTTDALNISASRPDIRLTITTAGTPVSTALNSTKTAYLGPNEDVYFYDGSGNIMARIKNLTAFDYGCTQVVIDRAGSGTSQFWNAVTSNYLTSKSFRVIPTNNTTTGSYQVTLYYSAAEVAGFNAAATPSAFATSQIVKVSNGSYITDVTPGTPHFADSYVSAGTNAVFGSLGNTLTATFSNTGFSGFAAGTPGNSLLTADYRSKATGNYSDVTKWEYNIFSANYIDANQVPTSASNVTIQAAHAITLDAGQTINSGKTLTVNGTLTAGTNTISGAGAFTLAAGGTFASSNTGTNGISQNIIASGTKTFTDGANYIFNGSTTAPFGSLFSTVRPNNLVIGANITLDKPVNITGTLGFSGSSRTLTTGSNLTLVSSATGTARVANLTSDFITAAAISGNSISGTATVERYIANAGHRSWHLLSANTTGTQTIYNAWQEAGVNVANKGTLITSNLYNGTNGFDATSNSASILTHNQGGAGGPSWNYNLANTNTTIFSSNPGYMLFVRGDRNYTSTLPTPVATNATVLKSAGGLKQGTQGAVTVSATGTGRTLVGNPFASAIDMETVFTGTANLDQNMYIWDPTLTGSQGVGGFRLVTRTGVNTYTHTPVVLGGTTSDATMRYIHSGSAFFLKATGSNASVIFTENMKAAPVTTVYNPIVATPGDQQLIANLMIVQPDNTASLADGIRVRYNAAYSALVTDDIEKMGNFAENISSYRDDKKLIVENRPMIAAKDTIFLHMTNTGIKDYRFQIGMIDFVQTAIAAYLEDIYKGSRTALDLSGGINNVDFSITADAGSANPDRFRIVFGATGPQPQTSTIVKAMRAAGSGADIAVEWKTVNQFNMKQYEVEHSADGIVYTHVHTQPAKGDNGSDVVYSWLDSDPFAGENYYRISSVSMSGDHKISNVARVTMSKDKAGITVYPNPATNRTLGLQFTGMEKGTYHLRLFNTAGQLVFTKAINHAGGNARQNLVFDQRIVKGNYRLEIIKTGNTKITQTILIAE